ncbi:hypothetical protein UB46_05185 [Burkholderiaceae bacterium 16]|nr:hypothetical protein UB46_05185 [Burkholderiaceae bacterium 16]
MDINGNALTGAQLEQFLDRLEADLEEGNSTEAADLLARLRTRPLRADSLESIDRLHTLWMRAGDSAAAQAVVNDDGAAVLALAQREARAGLRMHLALYRLQIANYLDEEEPTRQALGEMRAIVAEMPDLDANRYRQLRVFDSLERRNLDIALETVELRNALDGAVAQRAAFRAWDHADYQRRRAWALSRHGSDDEARAAAGAAILALQTADADQDVDEDDWLRLGGALIAIVPERLAAFQQAVTALTADRALPQRRELEVRLARLAARALHAQGDLPGALDACSAARHSLSSDGGDDFIEYELPWLIEAQRVEEAGRRAFFHIYQLEAEMWDGAARLVHARLADADDDSVWWPLCAMRACNTAETLERFISAAQEGGQDLRTLSPVHEALFGAVGEEDSAQAMQAVFAAARALAEQRSPRHPWITRLAAVHDAGAGRIDATTQAALLYAAAQEGGMDDNRTAYALFHARVQSLGLPQTLKLPHPSLPSGLWGYDFGVTIGSYLEEHLDSVPAELRNETYRDFIKLQTAAYEQGQACMERYFASGGGHPYDACAHLYSMMCNNLAINYRYDERRYEDAVDLHRRGIAASPFAEHYAGLLSVRIAMKDAEGIVSAAEQLWHYAAEHGYSRHDPNEYLGEVSQALYKLDRDREIPIWLERLVKWQREEGLDDDNLSTDALGVRLQMAFNLAHSCPEEASVLWSRIARQVEACSVSWMVCLGADTLHGLHRRAEAAALYERALALNPRSNEYECDDASAIEEKLALYRTEAKAPAKSWWQVWK